MRSHLTMLGVIVRSLWRSLLADILVGGVVGSLIAFVLALVVDGRVDGAAFQLRAAYEERVRVPVQNAGPPSDDGRDLHYTEVVGMRVQAVRIGTSRHPSVDEVDVTRTRTVTVMIIAGGPSRCPRFFGGNVPGHIDPSAVLIDRATAFQLGIGRGERIALITVLSGIDIPPIALEVTDFTQPYADPTHPAFVRGLVVIPESLLQSTERDAIAAADSSVVQIYHTSLHSARAGPGNGGSRHTRTSLAWESLTGGDITSDARLGSIGVAFFGALMWLLFGARSDRRLRARSARTRGLMVALGSRPSAVARSHITVMLIRVVASALVAATVVHAAFPVALGSYSQGAMVGVLVFYLVILALPNLLWSVIVDQRNRVNVFQHLYGSGE